MKTTSGINAEIIPGFTAALIVSFCFSLAGCSCLKGSCSTNHAEEPAPTPEETTLVTVGQVAPDFTLLGMDGKPFHLAEQRGRVVLINWFATWCPPCRQEMPHLQSRVWERFAGPDFVMVSIAREETTEIVAPFIKKYETTWPFLTDPDRQAYARYAEAYIPRNHLIDRQGRIIFQSQGFEEPEFLEMIEAISQELENR